MSKKPRNKATELPPSFKTLLTLNGWQWNRCKNDMSDFEDEWLIWKSGHRMFTVNAVADFSSASNMMSLFDHLTSEGVFSGEQNRALYAVYGLEWRD